MTLRQALESAARIKQQGGTGMDRDIRVVAEGFSFLECPRWHEGRVWMSDFYTYAVYSVLPDGQDLRREVEVPGMPAGLGWLPDGRLLVVSAAERKLLRREADGELVCHADLSAYGDSNLNEMVVDAQGRAYVGEFGFDVLAGAPFRGARLFRVDPDGSVQVLADELYFPNGSVITDEGVLLVNESFGNRVSAFDIQSDGSLAGRRVWAQFGPTPVAGELAAMIPAIVVGADGCTLDAAGALWIADINRGRLLRVRAGGEIVDEVGLPASASACMLGGPQGTTLFICEVPPAGQTVPGERQSRLSAIEVSVAHAGRP